MTIEAALRLRRPGGFTLDVALSLPARGVSVLFGPSGCGKTTLLRCLAGLEPQASGRVTVDGQAWLDDRHGLPPHQRAVGVVFQDAALFPHLSVRGNLDYGRRRIPEGEKAPALDAAIELLGIGTLLDRRPEGLSGGERQRVAIARALAMAPRLLLLDEPLASLDAARRAEVLPFLERLPEHSALPIVYVTHSLAEVARLADHLVLMEGGRVVAAGPALPLLSRLDSPVARDEDAGVVLACVVGERDAPWQLARLDFDGGALWARDSGQPLGARVRVRVMARDVSLATTQPPASSIANTLRGAVERCIDDPQHPALALAQIRVGGVTMLSRLTRRSAARLQLSPGVPVWAQVKSVALLE
jgi:molybdate transport system ATP-binding protein